MFQKIIHSKWVYIRKIELRVLRQSRIEILCGVSEQYSDALHPMVKVIKK